MSNVSGVIKSIQDIMRKDVGVDGDAQRISQLVWMFFLKIFDDREAELELIEDKYQSPLPKHLRWMLGREIRQRLERGWRPEQILDGLPEGPWIADDRKYSLPPRAELSTSMESLIHHFKLVTEGFRVEPGEVYNPVESPRGELGCFVMADGSSKPARVHFREPSFVNLQALADMTIGEYVADLIQTLAMLDPILGGIDR